MTASTTGSDSYDVTLFKILVYEFDFDSKNEAETKIRTKLRWSNLGAYDQERVNYIRSLKDEIQKDLSLFGKSKYFVGTSGATADQSDFDYDKMVNDHLSRYPKIGQKDVRTIVSFGIFVYYLR